MKTLMHRRRFLTMSAALAALPVAATAAPPRAEWRGTALGAEASLQLVGLTADDARDTFAAVEAELGRLEGIFSLYRADSDLRRLNLTGRLAAPPPEMLELLSLAATVHASTNGAFDPTIQPLWALHAASPAGVSDGQLAAALGQTGWRHVRVAPSEITLARPGMAMTLNGIAQGYVTDRVAELLRGLGYTDVLVDIGEVVGMGLREDGTAWNAGIAAPDGRLVHRTTLSDRALATSAPLGTVLDPEGKVGHIFDPRSGLPVAARELVSVSAQSAALADALSTAFCIMPDADIDAALAAHPSVSVEVMI